MLLAQAGQGRVSEERAVSSRFDTGVSGALCDFNCDHQKIPDLTLKDHVTTLNLAVVTIEVTFGSRIIIT